MRAKSLVPCDNAAISHQPSRILRSVRFGLFDIDSVSRTPDTGRMAASGFTADELIEIAKQSGREDFSARTLERWHKEDLIPRPDQQHVAGIRGSVGVGYPPGADDYLRAACRLMRKKDRINDARFEMWWEGFAIPTKAVKKTLKHYTAPSKELKSLRKQYPNPFDAAEAAATKVLPATTANQRYSPVIRFLKRNLANDEEVYSAVMTLLRLGFGDKPDWGAADVGEEASARSLEETLFTGWGLDAARADGMDGIDPWLSEGPESVPSMFRTLKKAGLGDVLHIGDLIERASDEELEQARRASHAIFEGLSLIAEALFAVYRRDFGGFGVFRILRPTFRDARLRALTIPALIGLGRVIPPKNIQRFAEFIMKRVPRFEAMLALANAVPESRPYIRPGGWLAFTALPDERQKEIAEKTKTFLAENPSIAAVLEDSQQIEM